jgi:TonB family protein
MKRCSACEFHVTMIDNRTLLERLAKEVSFLVRQLRRAWPEFKSDPLGFSRSVFADGGLRLRRALAAPNSLAAVSAAMLVVISAALILLLSDRVSTEKKHQEADERLAQITMLDFPNPNPKPEGKGVGAGSEGRVGFARGRGEGSAPEPKRSTGGGGGGNHNPTPAQIGKLPPPSPIPAPIPTLPPVHKQSLPAAGIDIDPALWQNLPMPVYGDPRSKSQIASNGPGEEGGMGNAKGQGVGDGNGTGVGPGDDGNMGDGRKGPGCCGPGGGQGNNPDDPDRIYPAPLVTERARVLAKPEPQYTEDARRNQITGSVVLRVVFSRTGEVTGIRAIHALPFGLTERAIAAARQIRFRPAIRDGRPVNVYMQLEYNFNLY